MDITVITPAVPFVLPSQIAGSPSPTDVTVAAQIAAVVESLAAPMGWLGRSLGAQTLEVKIPSFTLGPDCDAIRLPGPPIQSVTTIKYIDDALTEFTVANNVYRLVDRTIILKPDQEWPDAACEPDAVRVRYVAGYTTIPAVVTHAVILLTQQLRASSAENLFVRSEDVEGIGEIIYTVSDAADALIRKAASNLLAGLRVWS